MGLGLSGCKCDFDANYEKLAVSTRPPDGVLLASAALAARRLRRLASLLEL